MKTMMTLMVIATSVFAMNFEHMSNEEMMNIRGNVPSHQQADFQKEMQKRMKSMSPQQQQMFKNKNQNMMHGQGNMNSQNMMNSQRFEHMSNDEMIKMQADFQKEMQKRMKSMSPQQQQMFKNKNQNMMHGQGNIRY
jgi:mRNA-degrading endonuclease RelE of RelBE toxin-antitoxin system